MPGRELRRTDAAALQKLVATCRSAGAPAAFPGTEDLASLPADRQLAGKARLWQATGGAELVAWCLAQPDNDVDGYVNLHQAAFGTAYLTRERRLTWHDEPGYDAELDLMLVDGSDELAGFCVSWTHDRTAELGTIGVRPEHRRRGLGAQLARASLGKLAERGIYDVTLSTSSTNAAMLALASRSGFAESRRTHWLSRSTELR